MVAKDDQTGAKSNLELAGKELKSSIDALGEVWAGLCNVCNDQVTYASVAVRVFFSCGHNVF